MLPMEIRRQFVEDAQREWWSVTELCRLYGISRKTGYKWLARYARGGRRALADRSRRPQQSPDAVPADIVEALVRARRAKPYWGARKLRRWLQRTEPQIRWPVSSTIHTVLRRHGLVRQRRRRRQVRVPVSAQPLTVARRPNDVWTADFKGHFRLGSGHPCFPLTVRDLASRYTLRCDALPGAFTAPTVERFRRAFREYGVPRCIRTDNGTPFAGTGLAGLSRLAVWWVRLGIHVERIAPGRPDQNGSHERFHRDLKAQTTRPPAASLRGQQARFAAFIREYSTERPHEALRYGVPDHRYRPSRRALPAPLPPVEYPGHVDVRRVGSNGCILWREERLFLSMALAGEPVSLEEIDDGIWIVRFMSLPLARWCDRTRRLKAWPID